MGEAAGRLAANLMQAKPPGHGHSMIQATITASSGVATLVHDHEHEEEPYPVQSGLLSDKAAGQYIEGLKAERKSKKSMKAYDGHFSKEAPPKQKEEDHKPLPATWGNQKAYRIHSANITTWGPQAKAYAHAVQADFLVVSEHKQRGKAA